MNEVGENNLSRTSIVLQLNLYARGSTGADLPHFDSVASESLYTSSQPSASSLIHVGVRAPQDASSVNIRLRAVLFLSFKSEFFICSI